MELAVAKKPQHPVDTERTPVAQARDIIALIGFMGAGKTSVGEVLAERMGILFLDLDQAIVDAAGAPIAQIFREFGEVGFRARERSALRAVLTGAQAMVIATGGGTFADQQMREWLMARARTVFLQASADTLLRRLGDPDQRAMRPLLRGPDPEKTMRRLLVDRSPFYEQSEATVVTDTLDIPQIAEHVLRALGLDRLRAPTRMANEDTPPLERTRAPRRPALHDVPLEPGKTIDMTLSYGDSTVWTGTPHAVSYFDQASPTFAKAVADAAPGRNALLITDENVARLHMASLLANLRAVGKIITTHIVPPGEDSKRLSVVEGVYDALQNAELDRDDAVIALGGGVVGDLAGFAASTYLRGIACVQVPTSTLACVDAALGGKTGVNTSRAKNMVGTFTMPAGVFIAREYVMTQPQREHASGLAEVVK